MWCPHKIEWQRVFLILFHTAINYIHGDWYLVIKYNLPFCEFWSTKIEIIWTNWCGPRLHKYKNSHNKDNNNSNSQKVSLVPDYFRKKKLETNHSYGISNITIKEYWEHTLRGLLNTKHSSKYPMSSFNPHNHLMRKVLLHLSLIWETYTYRV